jgi:hypothetical protein
MAFSISVGCAVCADSARRPNVVDLEATNRLVMESIVVGEGYLPWSTTN